MPRVLPHRRAGREPGPRRPRHPLAAFAPSARAGFHSVHALPMRLRGIASAPSTSSTKPGEMRQADLDAAQALADVATIGILQHRAALEAQVVNDQLNMRSTAASSSSRRRAWSPNERARHGAGVQPPAGHARNHNLRLVDVASDVIGGKLLPSALDPVPAR